MKYVIGLFLLEMEISIDKDLEYWLTTKNKQLF